MVIAIEKMLKITLSLVSLVLTHFSAGQATVIDVWIYTEYLYIIICTLVELLSYWRF